MTEQELIEQLADKEHASWARWMNYVFDLGTTNEDGSFTLSPECTARWLRQANTDYKDLSEREKYSDREEVKHILPIIREYALSECGSSGQLAAQAWGLANAHTAYIKKLLVRVNELSGMAALGPVDQSFFLE